MLLISFVVIFFVERNDCGIFGMRLLERFDPRDANQCNFSHTDIPAFRIRYAHDMVMSDFNTEDDKKFQAAEFHQMVQYIRLF